MKVPILDIQKAVYDRISPLYKTFDSVPDGQQTPYVTLGEDVTVEWGTKTNPGTSVIVTLHFWSQYKGMKETKTMIDQVVQALSTPLQITGYELGTTSIELIHVMKDPDGITRHGIVEFKINILEV